MITIDIPGGRSLRLAHLVLDYNGTMACDGVLIDGVHNRLDVLSRHLKIHVITADTFGTVKEQLIDAPCEVIILEPQQQDVGKLRYVENLGANESVCIGNGQNDWRMLDAAGLGIVTLQQEGMAYAAWQAADVVVLSINDALDLLLKPKRLIATLRS